MKYSNYSAVIIGSGIAGLYAALKIDQQVDLPDGLLLITKSKLGESNSMYAQGGIVGVMKENKADSTASHISDTVNCSFEEFKQTISPAFIVVSLLIFSTKRKTTGEK